MANMTINRRYELEEFLDKNATTFTHNDIEGGGKTTVYELPSEFKDEFIRKFVASGVESTWDWTDYITGYGLSPDNCYQIVHSLFKEQEGPFYYHQKGYDFDGFYQSGEHGIHKCQSYYTYRKARMFRHHDRSLGKTRIYIDDDPNEFCVVAFM